MKRLSSIMLAIIICLSLCACGAKENDAEVIAEDNNIEVAADNNDIEGTDDSNDNEVADSQSKPTEIECPVLPVSVQYTWAFGDTTKVMSETNITSFDYEIKDGIDGELEVTLFFSGELTFDAENNGVAFSCVLYDEDGIPVEAMSPEVVISADKLAEDGTFENYAERIYHLVPGSYRLGIENLDFVMG